MPSWRNRRCATTAKPAAATSEASSKKTVATENIANVVFLWLLAGLMTPRRDPVAALNPSEAPLTPVKESIELLLARTRTVT
jgi:hypothetical protein